MKSSTLLHDLSGQSFGMLKVLGRDTTRVGTYWRCNCLCGRETSVRSDHLTHGLVTSCRFKGEGLHGYERHVQRTEACWGWSGGLDKDGYAIHRFSGRQSRAHIYSWEQANGPRPEGMFVLHTCDSPSCSNPDHLFLGTQKDNVEDMDTKGRRRKYGPMPQHPEETKNRARQLHKEGMSMKQIARTLRVPRSTIIRWCKEVSHRPE